MRSTILVSCLVSIVSSAATAQTIEMKLRNPEPYYRFTTSIPDVMEGAGDNGSLDMELFVSPSGNIEDVQFSAAGRLCESRCWEIGSPPREMCWIPVGCPGSGGGGGVLLEAPIMVELAPKIEEQNGNETPAYDLIVRPLTEGGADNPMQFDLELPVLPAQ